MEKKQFCPGVATLLVLACLLWGAPVSGFDGMPFSTRSQNPFVAVYGLPAAETAGVIPSGQSLLRAVIDVASNYIVEYASRETVIQDGEVWRLNLAYRYGLRGGMEVGIEIPYFIHTGGFLDGVINTWHNATGLPDGGRGKTGNDQLNYAYTRNGEVLINTNDSTAGIGDIRITGAYQLYGDNRYKGRMLALHAGLKLPTGNSGDLTGSDAVDISVSLAARDTTLSLNTGLSFYGSCGLLFPGSGDLLNGQQRQWVGFGAMGMGWQMLDWVTPKIQIDWHSPFYRDSQLSAIDAWSAQLALGGTFHLSANTAVDVAIVEDIAVDTAPDVLFHVALKKRY